MDYPKISIITPSYNQGAFLERTILSIIEQNYPNIEYLIIDGGSTDNSVEIIRKYEKRIDYWISEKDNGQTEAINKGMKRATGDIVCWINSDDILLPGALKIVGTYFIKHPDIEFLNGLTIEIDKNDSIIKITNIIINKWFFQHGCYNISQQGMFWKRSLFKRLGYLNESFHAKMDVEWLIRMYEFGIMIKLINKPLGAIRIHKETKTALKGNIWAIDAEKINIKYNGKYHSRRLGYILILFFIVKLFKGCYLRNLLFSVKFKNLKIDCFTNSKNKVSITNRVGNPHDHL